MNTILAIDMGKNKSVYCQYDPAHARQEFGTVRTSPKDFHDLLVRHAADVVVIEIGPLAGWVADLCQTLGVKLRVVNTSSDAWSWNKIKNKSDRKDAQKIAVMQAMGQHRYVHMPSADVRQWRELIGYRAKAGQSGRGHSHVWKQLPGGCGHQRRPRRAEHLQRRLHQDRRAGRAQVRRRHGEADGPIHRGRVQRPLPGHDHREQDGPADAANQKLDEEPVANHPAIR